MHLENTIFSPHNRGSHRLEINSPQSMTNQARTMRTLQRLRQINCKSSFRFSRCCSSFSRIALATFNQPSFETPTSSCLPKEWDSLPVIHFNQRCSFSSKGDGEITDQQGSDKVDEDIVVKEKSQDDEKHDDETPESHSEGEAPPQVDHSLFTEEVKIRMPDMGEGDGKILCWYKQVGDLIRRDEPLCTIETEVSVGWFTRKHASQFV